MPAASSMHRSAATATRSFVILLVGPDTDRAAITVPSVPWIGAATAIRPGSSSSSVTA
jgi:hypothetical protein